MKAYKGFNHDWTCKDFQYEIGKTYETDNILMCERGFHACTQLEDAKIFEEITGIKT